jgi:hypothetical protein
MTGQQIALLAVSSTLAIVSAAIIYTTPGVFAFFLLGASIASIATCFDTGV